MSTTTLPSTPILLYDLGTKFPSNTSTQKRRYGLYLCQCGIEFEAQTTNVNNGNTVSCGCYKKQRNIEVSTTHGLRSHRLYNIWIGMVQRCINPKDKAYKYYGARGITVCERWLSIENFIEDMYPTYIEGLSIDRRENNKGYSLENCRWETDEVQNRNQRQIRSTNKSGYRGVSWQRQASKWQVSISLNSKSKYLGIYDTALDAAIAYDTYVIANNLEHTINGVLEKESL